MGKASSDCITRAPDHYQEDEKREMECAYINDLDQITVDRLQVLMHIRPNNKVKKGSGRLVKTLRRIAMGCFLLCF